MNVSHDEPATKVENLAPTSPAVKEQALDEREDDRLKQACKITGLAPGEELSTFPSKGIGSGIVHVNLAIPPRLRSIPEEPDEQLQISPVNPRVGDGRTNQQQPLRPPFAGERRSSRYRNVPRYGGESSRRRATRRGPPLQMGGDAPQDEVDDPTQGWDLKDLNPDDIVDDDGDDNLAAPEVLESGWQKLKACFCCYCCWDQPGR